MSDWYGTYVIDTARDEDDIQEIYTYLTTEMVTGIPLTVHSEMFGAKCMECIVVLEG